MKHNYLKCSYTTSIYTNNIKTHYKSVYMKAIPDKETLTTESKCNLKIK